MYMTLGCSRSPVTVAVPSSSRSILGADFGPAFGLRRRAACWPLRRRPRRIRLRLAGLRLGGCLARLGRRRGGLGVGRRGCAGACAAHSPRVARRGFAGRGGAGGGCAAAGLDIAQINAIKLKVLVAVLMLAPSWRPVPARRRVCAIPPPSRQLACSRRRSRGSARIRRAPFAAVQGINRRARPSSDAPERNSVQRLSYADRRLRLP